MIFAIVSLPFLTALALDAPMSPSEQVLVGQCLAEGASASECACGLEFARERLTVRQMDLFAELTPMMADLPNVSTAEAETVAAVMAAAMERAQEQGYSADEIIAAMGIAFENADAVVAACDDANQESDPADDAIVEGLKDNAGDSVQ